MKRDKFRCLVVVTMVESESLNFLEGVPAPAAAASAAQGMVTPVGTDGLSRGVSAGADVSDATVGDRGGGGVTAVPSTAKFHVLAVDSLVLASYCWGYIGYSGRFACMSAKEPNSETCGTSHRGRTIFSPEVGDIILVERSGERLVRALPILVFKGGVAKVPALKLTAWLTTPRTAGQWRTAFLDYDSTVNFVPVELDPSTSSVAASLKTPAKNRAGKPKSSWDEDEEEEEEDPAPIRFEGEFPLFSEDETELWTVGSGVSSSLASGIAQLTEASRFFKLDVESYINRSVAPLLRSLSDRTSDAEIASDLSLLGENVDAVVEDLGSPGTRAAQLGASVFSVLEGVLEKLDSAPAPVGGGEAAQVRSELTAAHSSGWSFASALVAKGWTGFSMDERLKQAERTGDLLIDLIKKLRVYTTSQETQFVLAKRDWEVKFQALVLQGQGGAPVPSASSTFNSDLEFLGGSTATTTPGLSVSGSGEVNLVQELLRVQAELKSLRTQVSQSSGSCVRVKELFFQDLRDVQAWVQRHLAKDNFNFGVFGDCISACEVMRNGSSSSDNLGSKLKNAKGAGFESMLEERVLNSVRNGLPTLFMGTGESSSSAPLPRLDKPSKWEDPEVFDGGMKPDLMTFMATQYGRVLESRMLQLHSAEARALALELQNRTSQFWTLAAQNISNTQIDFTVRAKLPVPTAWNFCMHETKRMLEDCNDPRISALDIGVELAKDRAYVCSVVLFAILKCHMVMEEYVYLQFRNHPSVASERVKLLVNCFAQSNVSSLTEEIGKQKAVAEAAKVKAQAVNQRVDSLSSKVDTYIKSHK